MDLPALLVKMDLPPLLVIVNPASQTRGQACNTSSAAHKMMEDPPLAHAERERGVEKKIQENF